MLQEDKVKSRKLAACPPLRLLVAFHDADVGIQVLQACPAGLREVLVHIQSMTAQPLRGKVLCGTREQGRPGKLEGAGSV